MASSSNTWSLAGLWYCIRYCEDPSKVKGMGADTFSGKVSMWDNEEQVAFKYWTLQWKVHRLCDTDNRATGASRWVRSVFINKGFGLSFEGLVWITVEERGRHSGQQGKQKQAQKQKCHANVIVCPNFNDSAVLGGDFDLIVISISRKRFQCNSWLHLEIGRLNTHIGRLNTEYIHFRNNNSK